MDFSSNEEIEEWIQHLPLGDVRTASRVIYSAVSDLNNSHTVLRHHLAFLERIGPSVHHVLGSLQKYYADAHFPLPSRARKAARMADDLCELLIHSHQLVLREISDRSLGKSADDPRIPVWQTVAHRILYYSQRILVNQLTLDLEERSNFWLRIYRLYLASFALTPKDRVIRYDALEGYPESSIAQLFTRILLISLVPLRSMRNSQIGDLFATLDYWASRVEVRFCKGEESRKRTQFLFDANQDVGPSFTGDSCGECPQRRCLLVYTAELCAALNHCLLKAARSGEDPLSMEGVGRISVSTLDILKSCWKDRQKRADFRREGNSRLEVIFSISAIHKALKAECEEEQGGAQSSITPLGGQSNGLGVNGSLGGLSLETERDSPLSSPSPSPFQDPQAAPPNGEGEIVPFYPAEVLDHSENGYRLRVELSDNLRVRVGDLVGLRSSENSVVTLGVVRWITEPNPLQLLFGVLLIARDPVHAAVDPGTESASLRGQPCLIAEHIRSEKTILLLDHIPQVREKRVTLYYENEKIPIAFNGWPVEESRSFEAFEFGIRRGENTAPDPELPMLTLMWLRALTQKESASEEEVPPVAGDDAFSGWLLD